ncbi:antibiotic biosynthesis monooxygenase family protein [Pradoshia sp.]|uniref:antibiotic biosynthesis monooxygenase family protein n=1 Tax=Pradoshia sp. TaxID=2651281 RepID=UPI003F05864F
MNFYITSGTLSFLKIIQQKHSSSKTILLNNPSTSMLLHESSGKSFFQSPRTFEVIEQSGQLKQEGFFSLHYIPVSPEDRPSFEQDLKKAAQHIPEQPGLRAYRLLRPISSDSYVVLTNWSKEQDYARFDQAKIFTNKKLESLFNTQVLFTGKPYTTTLHAYKDKDKD